MSAARTPRVTRRRARAPRGTRARGAVPRHRGPVTTLIAGLSLAGMSPAMTVVGGTTAAVFAPYLEKVLIPALQPGQVVVDNVGAHKPDPMRSLVEAAGCRLLFLPAGPVPGRGGLQQDQDYCPGRRSAHPGSPGRRYRSSPD